MDHAKRGASIGLSGKGAIVFVQHLPQLLHSKSFFPLGRLAYYGLYALQHRGQESCGIVVNDDGVFASHKDLGLVGEVFSEEIRTAALW